MIGQLQLQEKLNKIMETYPKFSIIVGPKGSGKKTICKYICKKLILPIITFGTSVDNVRQAIDLAYEQYEPTCYMFPDADGMSVSAKNALLKVTEEPPKNAYFMLTLLSMSNTLETIQSRGTVFQLDAYNTQELISYRKYKQYKPDFDSIIEEICSCTGEVDELFTNDIPSFYKFANTIVDNIHIPNTGNIFKISKQIKTKEDDNGYDGVLLFKAVRSLYIKKAKQTKCIKHLQAANVTTQCIKDLMLPSINKIATVDKWIMDVRQVLRSA